MFKNIVLATDGSNHSTKAANVAADIAATYGSRLIIINVFSISLTFDEVRAMPQAERFLEEARGKVEQAWDLPSQIVVSPETIPLPISVPYEVLNALSNEITADAEKIAKTKGVNDTLRISVHGKPAEQIIELSENQNADLIVLGTRGLSDISALVTGSVSHKVIHMTRCPCLLVK